MARRGGGGSGRPGPGGGRGRFGPGGSGPRQARSPLGLRPLGGGDYELIHPPCVEERRLDVAEGLEIWRAGEPEEARDALRHALDGCGDNLWAHVALGRLALEAMNDPVLARGHFGYAVELVERALPRGFSDRLPRNRPGNQPFHEAAAGLARTFEALGRPGDAAEIQARAARLAGDPQAPRQG